MAAPARQHRHVRQRGAALLICMLFTALLLGSMGVLMRQTVVHVRQSQYAAWRCASLAAADTALALAARKMAADNGSEMGYGGGAQAILTGQAPLPPLTDPAVTPQSITGAPEVRWYAIAGPIPGGDPDHRVVVAVARVHQVTSAVEGVYQRREGEGDWVRLSWRERVVTSGVD